MLLQIRRGICFFIALKEAEDNLQKIKKMQILAQK